MNSQWKIFIIIDYGVETEEIEEIFEGSLTEAFAQALTLACGENGISELSIMEIKDGL